MMPSTSLMMAMMMAIMPMTTRTTVTKMVTMAIE